MTNAHKTRLFVALAALALCAAACGATPVATGPSTTPVPSTSVATSTTTTTLPPTVGLPGTPPLGSLQVLGSIQRVIVNPPGPGQLAVTPTATGEPLAPSEKIAFRRFGSGPDLLLIAGEHSTITSWDPQFLTDLAQHYRVTLFDPPGIGYSPPGLAIPSIRSYADAAAGLANALGLVTPIAVGWGLGGGVALSLAERHPRLFSGIVLVNSTVGAPGEQVAPAAAALLGSAEVTPTMLSRLYFPDSASLARLGWLERISDVSPDSLITSGVGEEAAVQTRATADHSLVANLSKIATPVLVMSGADDVVTPPASGRTIADALPHATYVTIPKAGYACFSDAEPEVLRSISSFVSAALG